MKKMSKKKITSILAVCLLLIIAFAGFTIWKTKSAVNRCIDLIAYGSGTPLVGASESCQILTDFPDEIACVQKERGVAISELTDQTFDLIKSVAVTHWEDPALNFSGLIHDITQVSFRCRISAINASLRTSQEGLDTADFEIQNDKQTVLVPYGALSSRVNEDHLTRDTAAKINGTFEFKPGTTVQGVPITTHFTSDYTYTLMGPKSDDRLSGMEDQNPTHSIGLSILYGSVVRQEYDLLHLPSGRTYHVDRTVLADSFIESYTLKCAISIPFYAQHASKPAVFEYENIWGFLDEAEHNPGRFVF